MYKNDFEIRLSGQSRTETEPKDLKREGKKMEGRTIFFFLLALFPIMATKVKGKEVTKN